MEQRVRRAHGFGGPLFKAGGEGAAAGAPVDAAPQGQHSGPLLLPADYVRVPGHRGHPDGAGAGDAAPGQEERRRVEPGGP